jgi:NAD(P)-dependent dehydrogenase (short-subunit alcohol dehydrogenase family)
MAFEGKVALITGAGSGLGRLMAQRLTTAGVAVAGLDQNQEGLRETGAEREGFRAWPLDVSDARAVEATVREVESELGPIDRVVNAAAIMPTALLLDQDAALINRIMEVNYCGTVNVTMATLPGMLERGKGDLINFASIAGWLPIPHFGAYNASKFAVVAFTEVLAHENRASGVRFSCVCPPPVDTPLLAQATSRPKVLDEIPPIAPEAVLDAIEAALEKRQLFVFPGRGSKAGWRARRWVPGLVWRRFHKMEGV